MRLLIKWCAVAAVCFVGISAAVEDNPGPAPGPTQNLCKAQKFDQDSVVCVCDESHCDYLVANETPDAGQYTVITSDKNGKRFETETRQVEEQSNYDVHEQCYSILTNKTVYITPNQDQRAQEIIGFGGAFTDAVGYNLNLISDKLVDHVFKSYFGQEGLRYNLARNPIAHTDFSLTEYYYDNTDYDVNMTDFKLADEDYKYRIPYIKRASSMVKEGLLLFGSIWTCPEWMRGYNDDNLRVKVLEEYFEAYCLYIMKYLEAYKAEGLEHYAVSYANEPTITMGIKLVEFTEQTMTVWTLNRLVRFAEDYFIPALTKNFPETKMMFFDDNRDVIIGTWLQVEARYKSFNSKLQLAGFHSYFDGYLNPDLLEMFFQSHPGVTIITSELSIGEAGNLGLWSYAEFYASSIIQEMNYHTSGWIDWNLLLDTKSQPCFAGTPDNAPIIVDTEKNVFYKQPTFYALGHFSKFIPRGSVKIGCESQFATSLQYVCVQRPDGYLVAVLHNTSNDTVNVNILGSDGIISIDATPNSISTVIFNK